MYFKTIVSNAQEFIARLLLVPHTHLRFWADFSGYSYTFMHYGSRCHSCSTKYPEMGNNTDAREGEKYPNQTKKPQTHTQNLQYTVL